MEFCYLVRQSVLYESDIHKLDQHVADFHKHRQVFIEAGLRSNFNLPRQHSIIHYAPRIRDFAAPNGLCSSITESKHIRAVKDPYRRTNHYKEMGQMLIINQRMDKMNSAFTDFACRGMLDSDDPFTNILPSIPQTRTNQLQNDDLDDDLVSSDVIQLLAEVRLCKTRGADLRSSSAHLVSKNAQQLIILENLAS
jgi:hypothetical protein